LRDTLREERSNTLARGRSQRGSGSTGWASSTPIERTAVELVLEGLTNARIAGRMFVTTETVTTQLAHILGNLEVTNDANP
jgi:DNA-binding NarL/FixJ family response regulator